MTAGALYLIATIRATQRRRVNWHRWSLIASEILGTAAAAIVFLLGLIG